MVINKRINRIVIQFQPEEAEPPSSLVVDDTHSPGVADGIMRQFRAHEDIVVILPNRDTQVIPFYSILGIVTQFEINEVTITDDVCRPYSGGEGGGGTTANVVLYNYEEAGIGFVIYDDVAGNVLESFEVASTDTVTKQVEIGRYVSPEVDPNEVEISKFGQCTLHTDDDGYYYYLIGGDCEIYVGTMH